MNKKTVARIFKDTAYVRAGGTDEELRCAQYIKDTLSGYGAQAYIEPFKVPMGTIREQMLMVDEVNIPCKAYMLCDSGTVKAPLYYLANTDRHSLSRCRDKIVMVDGYLGRWIYKDAIDSGAAAIITYDGSVNYSDRDIDQRELRSTLLGEDGSERKVLCVNINAKDAAKLIKNGAQGKEAMICVTQDEYEGESRNVVLELPGETDETIVFTAHYDSTYLSKGAYDNMSGSIGLMAIAEHFLKNTYRYTLRFIWCGSEERGLLGSKAYCAAHEDALEKVVLNINLDMIGSVMGRFIACCTAEEKLVGYIEYMASEKGFGMKAYQDVYSSDSTPFADKGVPAVSFARIAPTSTATIHNRYDTYQSISADNMLRDISFITDFASRMANAKTMPVAKQMPDKMREELDYYMLRKRRPQK